MKILNFLWLILLVGCVTSASRTNRLAVGMSKEEAIGIMGTPLATTAVGDLEYLEYRIVHGSVLREQVPFVIALRQGQVTAYGHPFNIAGPPQVQPQISDASPNTKPEQER